MSNSGSLMEMAVITKISLKAVKNKVQQLRRLHIQNIYKQELDPSFTRTVYC